MSNDDNTSNQQIEIECQIIHLMLKYREAIDEMFADGYGIDVFIPQHQLLVKSIYDEYMDSGHTRLLNKESYTKKLLGSNVNNLFECTQVYDKCFVGVFAEFDDLGHLKKSFIENIVSKKTLEYIKQYSKNSKKLGNVSAARILSDDLQQLTFITETGLTVFAPVSDMKKEYLQKLKDRADNKDNIVRCGLPEIDDAIRPGFAPGQLTLFVADVGGHKSNFMLNVALGIFNKGHDILFIPLEMDRFSLIDRMISNIAGVNSHRIYNPELMNNDERKKVEEAAMWADQDHKFYILDAYERTSVSKLKTEIENHAQQFKPAVVVIDYIANLEPDLSRGSRNDLEIGDILKNLRFLGKQYGFHIMSAAQMNRATIKALREGKESSVDSTAIHGSHQYSADSDTIFALMQNPNETDRIKVLTIKARHGPKNAIAELQLNTALWRITSTQNTMENAPTGIEDFEEAINEPVSEIVDSVQENKHGEEKKKPFEFAPGLDDLDLGD